MEQSEVNAIALDFLHAYRDNDFRLFAKYVKIPHEAEDKFIPFSYDCWHQEQKDFYANRTGTDIVLKPRQIGMSVFLLALDLFYALSPRRQGAVVAIVVQNAKTKDFLMRAVKQMYQSLRDVKRETGLDFVCPEADLENANMISFVENSNSIYVINAGDKFEQANMVARGMKLSRLHLSEVAFWQQAPETMSSVLATARPGAEIVIESTPYGTDNLFYDYFQAAIMSMSRFKAHFYPWFIHTSKYSETEELYGKLKPLSDWDTKLKDMGATDDQVRWWQRKVQEIGLDKALQEYPMDQYSCFRSAESVFLTMAMESHISHIANSPDLMMPMPWDTKLSIWEMPEPGHKYVVSADVAMGTGNDSCALVVLDRNSREVMACLGSSAITGLQFTEILLKVAIMYNRALLVWEDNGPGYSITEQLYGARYGNLYSSDEYSKAPYKIGFRTTGNTRPMLFAAIKEILREQVPTRMPLELASQLKRLQKNPKSGKLEGKGSSSDDFVIAYGLALKVIEADAWKKVSNPLTRATAYTPGKQRLWSSKGGMLP